MLATLSAFVVGLHREFFLMAGLLVVGAVVPLTRDSVNWNVWRWPDKPVSAKPPPVAPTVSTLLTER